MAEAGKKTEEATPSTRPRWIGKAWVILIVVCVGLVIWGLSNGPKVPPPPPTQVAIAPLGFEPAKVRSRYSGPYDVTVVENSREWIHFTYIDRDGNIGHRQWRRDETRGLRWFDNNDHCSPDSPCPMAVVWSDKERRWLQNDKPGEDIWVESKPVAEKAL